MSEWISRISDHPIWAEMVASGQLIDEILTTGKRADDEIVDLERIRTVLSFIGKRLAAADRLIVTPNVLDEIASAFSGMLVRLKGFSTELDPARLKEANHSADAAIQYATRVLSPGTPEELTALGEAAATYRTTLEGIQHTIRAQSDSLRSDLTQMQGTATTELETLRTGLAEVSATLQTERERLSKLVTEQQDQFAKAQETRTTDFSAALQNALTQVTQLSTDYQKQFSAAQDTRGTDFTDAQTVRQTKFQEVFDSYSASLRDEATESSKQREALLQAHQTDLTQLTKDYQTKAEDVLKRVEAREQDVIRLVGAIGNVGVTSGYLDTANSARKSLWFWQTVAVASMAGLIVTAIIVFYPALKGEENFSWPGFAGRVFITLTIGALAAYAAKQADNFFDVERRNRKLALELEAIGPFLDPLPVDLKDKFRIEIGERSFGQQDVAHGGKRSPATTLELFMTLLDSKEFQKILDIWKKTH